MLRRALVGAAAMLFLAGIVLADDKKNADKAKSDAAKEVKAQIVKVNAGKNLITVKTAEGEEKEFDVPKDSKVIIGPKGTPASKAGLKDKRLVKGTSVTLVFAEDDKTVKELRVATGRASTRGPTGDIKATPDK